MAWQRRKCGKSSRKMVCKRRTVIYVSADGCLIGLIALADTVREDAKSSIARLQSIGITPALLTGDNAAAANAIAGSVGITEVHSNLLPEDKMSLIKNYNESDNKVCMIGDGVNDRLRFPQLTQALPWAVLAVTSRLNPLTRYWSAMTSSGYRICFGSPERLWLKSSKTSSSLFALTLPP
jgi:high-affinity K+ transport system ATPase subunit B